MDHLRRSSLNFFATGALDRVAERRSDDAWIAERLGDAGSRVALVRRTRNLIVLGDVPAPVWFDPGALGGAEALGSRAILLGEIDGVAYFALEFEEAHDVERHLTEDAEFHELRDVGGLLDARDGALLAYARALTFWHERHRHCGLCGSPTRSIHAGHMRECTSPGCGAKHFPRTDPAVIVLVVDPGEGDAEERCLLGRQPEWPARLYSTVAGFVEPGESLEHAVVREVAEETGVRVSDVHYHSSQPWPFPSSLMLGFTARAETRDITRRDDELEDARWFTRAQILAALDRGELRLPRRVSIAFRLVEDWFDDGALGRFGEHLDGSRR